MEEEKKKRRVHAHSDKFSAFERDLIRAARDKLDVTFETCDVDDVVVGQVIQVDSDFTKFKIDGEDEWFNMSTISKLKIHASQSHAQTRLPEGS